MTIVFSMNDQDSERLEGQVARQLKELHYRDRNIQGAQVTFREEGGGAAKVCAIDLSHYGEPVSVCKSAASYEEAANNALAELTQKVGQGAKSIPS
jgi:hypothetical protein